MENYYGMRRKRNIDLSHLRPPLSQKNIDWENEDVVELEEGYEYEEVETYEAEELEQEEIQDENQPYITSDENNEVLFLNGKPFVPKPMDLENDSKRIQNFEIILPLYHLGNPLIMKGKNDLEKVKEFKKELEKRGNFRLVQSEVMEATIKFRYYLKSKVEKSDESRFVHYD